MQGVGKSLAGRIAVLELENISFSEITHTIGSGPGVLEEMDPTVS